MSRLAAIQMASGPNVGGNLDEAAKHQVQFTTPAPPAAGTFGRHVGHAHLLDDNVRPG